MPHTTEDIARKLEEFAEFLRTEYLDPNHFDGWPGLPIPEKPPGVQEQPPKVKLENANLYVLGCTVDMNEVAWRAWNKARRFCEEIVPESHRRRMWHWIAEDHSPDQWSARKREYDLHRYQSRHDAIHRIAGVIARNYDGDPRRIWEGARGIDVLKRFRDELKVGEQISRMVVGGLRDHKLVTLV